MPKDYGQVASEDSLNNAKSALEANGFTVKVVDHLKAAYDLVLNLIPEGSEVFTATSVTLTEAGLDEELNRDSQYRSARNKFIALYGQPDKAVEMRQLGSASDYAVGSVHAITEDGKVMIASNSGSQLPNYAYGASHVIWVVGTQKIVKDLDEAWDRMNTHTFPLEDARAQKAYGIDHTVLSKVLLYLKDPQQRVTVVFVKQAVGF